MRTWRSTASPSRWNQSLAAGLQDLPHRRRLPGVHQLLQLPVQQPQQVLRATTSTCWPRSLAWSSRSPTTSRSKMSLAYYDWKNIEGQLSDPVCAAERHRRGQHRQQPAAFAQKGNTYRPIRNITPTALNGFGTTNQFNTSASPRSSPDRLVRAAGFQSLRAGADLPGGRVHQKSGL
jgi:hypothetical protein